MARHLWNLAALLAALFPARTLAAEVRARLDYAVAAGVAGCPTGADLEREVRARLPGVTFRADAPRTVRARVLRDPAGELIARVALVDPAGRARGERVIRGRGAPCADMLKALALAVSIALDPTAAVAPPAPPPAPPPRSPARRLTLFAGGSVSGGGAPSVQGGIRLGADYRWRWLRASIEGEVALPAGGDAVGGGEVRALAAGGTVAGCGHVLMLYGCVSASLLGYVASASDLPAASTAVALVPAVGLRAGLELPVYGRLLLRLSASLSAPLRRPRLLRQGSDEPLYEVAPVIGGGALDLVVAVF